MIVTRADKAHRGAGDGPAFEDPTVLVRHILNPCRSTSFCNQSAHGRQRGSIPCSFQPWKATCALSDAVLPKFGTTEDREQLSCPTTYFACLLRKSHPLRASAIRVARGRYA